MFAPLSKIEPAKPASHVGRTGSGKIDSPRERFEPSVLAHTNCRYIDHASGGSAELRDRRREGDGRDNCISHY